MTPEITNWALEPYDEGTIVYFGKNLELPLTGSVNRFSLMKSFTLPSELCDALGPRRVR